MTAGSSAPSVKVVSSGLGGVSPASSHTGVPARRASSSHSAQSSALRAPPGGSSRCSPARSMPASMRARARLDRGDHVLGVVVQVVDAGGLAAAAVRAVVERDDHDVLVLEHETRRCGTARRSGSRLDLDAELQRAPSVVGSEADQLEHQCDPQHARRPRARARRSRAWPASGACRVHTALRFHSMSAKPPKKATTPNSCAKPDQRIETPSQIAGVLEHRAMKIRPQSPRRREDQQRARSCCSGRPCSARGASASGAP